MKALLIGIGAAGNKAVVDAVNSDMVMLEDAIIVNSTSKDFPKDFEGIKITLSDEDSGCGKERKVAYAYARTAIENKKFSFDEKIAGYDTVIIATSVEGGTGSGATPILAKFFKKVYNKNVHVIAFSGFEDDVRGLANTVDFFKDIDPAITVQIISNKSFLAEAGNNKLHAEELANKDMARRIRVVCGYDFIDGSQNIDDTDILKLSNTPGYMAVEKKAIKKSLETVEDFNKTIKSMIYNSSSIKTESSSKRIGIILNIKEESKDAVDYSFHLLKDEYGKPFEFFTQVQYDGKEEYIAYIVSGMKLPIDEVEAVYNRYKEESALVNKSNDDFFSKIGSMDIASEDGCFDMVIGEDNGISVSDFLNNL